MSRPVAFDVDGVLANFVKAHIELIKDVYGIKLPKQSNTFPDKWDYHLPYLTDEQDKEIWDIIGKSPSFWEDLEALDEPLLERLSTFSENSGQLYFVTNRFGVDAKRQTEAFLSNWIVWPAVLVAKDKSPILRSLKVSLFVDDKPGNCVEASAVDGLTIIMPDRSYNRDSDIPGVKRSYDVVADIEEFLA